MMLQPASFTEDDFGTDDAIRTDNCFRAELCFWINDRSRMNFDAAHVALASTSMNVTSASLTGSEST